VLEFGCEVRSEVNVREKKGTGQGVGKSEDLWMGRWEWNNIFTYVS